MWLLISWMADSSTAHVFSVARHSVAPSAPLAVRKRSACVDRVSTHSRSVHSLSIRDRVQDDGCTALTPTSSRCLPPYRGSTLSGCLNGSILNCVQRAARVRPDDLEERAAYELVLLRAVTLDTACEPWVGQAVAKAGRLRRGGRTEVARRASRACQARQEHNLKTIHGRGRTVKLTRGLRSELDAGTGTHALLFGRCHVATTVGAAPRHPLSVKLLRQDQALSSGQLGHQCCCCRDGTPLSQSASEDAFTK